MIVWILVEMCISSLLALFAYLPPSSSTSTALFIHLLLLLLSTSLSNCNDSSSSFSISLLPLQRSTAPSFLSSFSLHPVSPSFLSLYVSVLPLRERGRCMGQLLHCIDYMQAYMTYRSRGIEKRKKKDNISLHERRTQ